MVFELLGIKLIYPAAVFMVGGLSLIVSLLSSSIHRVVVDRKKMDAIRQKVEAHQKDMLEAQKANDEKKLKKLENEQNEIMGLVKNNMIASMKPALFTMPIFLVLIWWMSGNYAALGPILDLPIGLPFLTHAVEAASIVNGVDWFGLYIVIAIGTSLSLELVLRQYLKM